MQDFVAFQLAEHMKEQQCPICSLLHHRTKKAMESILYEGINDPHFREAIQKSMGFCNYHANMLMDIGDPLAHAILYDDLLLEIERQFGKEGMNYFASPHSHEQCTFCETARSTEKDYVSSFFRAFEDDTEFKGKYQEAGILCVTHLSLINRMSGSHSQALTDITKITISKYAMLRKELAEIRKRNDYRFAGDSWPESLRGAWKRAVGIINDKAGVRK